ncbi:hypothetical protein [Dongia deserti]|uniref:hypothetical protein n=1 Tax=Dongia deserti TaxID=2268030 RepID=UPI0013C484A0|nr:hypothetical protein [Dongia deserti]
MFTLNTERIVKWPVIVEVPVDGGETRPEEFEVSFKLIPTDQLAGFGKFEDVIVGWSGVNRETITGQKEELPFSKEALGTMLRIPYARAGIARAFVQCMTGAKRKNSGTPLATGPAATIQPPATIQ